MIKKWLRNRREARARRIELIARAAVDGYRGIEPWIPYEDPELEWVHRLGGVWRDRLRQCTGLH